MNTKAIEYPSLCMQCITHRMPARGFAVTMLTGYCGPVAACDACEYVTTLAMTRLDVAANALTLTQQE